MTDQETIFDKIIRKEIPADVVYEDDQVLAFRDINPQAPVHVLVIPKVRHAHVGDLKDRDLMGELFIAAAEVARQEGLEQDGYRLVVNTGDHGGQTVDHLHIHVIGGRQLKWPPG
jgi:histidine triad (HIT) family protein